jgi:hypothetical protein
MTEHQLAKFNRVSEFACDPLALESCAEIRRCWQRIAELETALKWVIAETSIAGAEWGAPHIAKHCADVLAKPTEHPEVPS